MKALVVYGTRYGTAEEIAQDNQGRRNGSGSERCERY